MTELRQSFPLAVKANESAGIQTAAAIWLIALAAIWLIALAFNFVRCRYTVGSADAELSKCNSIVVSVMATEINLALCIFS